MVKHLFLSIFLNVMVSATNGQILIKGVIIDSASSQPLGGVIIKHLNSDKAFVSDTYGRFNIKVMPRDKLSFSYLEYRTITKRIVDTQFVKVRMRADNITLDDVIISQRSNQQSFNTLAKIDLMVNPVKNTQELMRIVPGLFIAQHAGGGKAEQIFLRGFDCDHGTDVQVNVDGLPVNMVSHAHGHGYADAHFIIPETINNIDYGAGPYYSQQGNLNTAGYVNFNTFNTIPQSRVQIEAGRFDMIRTLVMIDLFKTSKETESLYAAGEFYYNNGPTINKQKLNRYNLFAKYNSSLSEKMHITTSLSAFKSNWNASGQIPDRAVQNGSIDRFGAIDPSEGGNTERYNAAAKLVSSLSDNTSFESHAYYSHYKFNLYSNFTFYLNDPINGDGINQSESRHLSGFSSRIINTSQNESFILKQVYSIGLRNDHTLNSQLNSVNNRSFLSNLQLGDIKETNIYGYSQHQLRLGRWLFEAGLRFDHFSFNYFNKLSDVQSPAQQKSILNPKISLQYCFSPALQLYFKGGKGFHSNDTRVVVTNKGFQILPAAYGTDLGLILKPTSRLFLNIAAWYLYLDQEFVYVGDAGIVEPSGRTSRRGLDFLARYQLSSKLYTNLNLNITKPRTLGEPKGEDLIPLAPTATSTGGIYYKPTFGLNGGLSFRYIKNRPANEDNSITAKGYFVTDASINYTKKKYEFGLSVENVTNAIWNEAQFATESRLQDEPSSITELHYTPGTPFFVNAKLSVFF